MGQRGHNNDNLRINIVACISSIAATLGPETAQAFKVYVYG